VGTDARTTYLAIGKSESGCYGQYGGTVIVSDGIALSGNTCTLTFHCSNGTHLNSKAFYNASAGCPSRLANGACVPLAPTNLGSAKPPPSANTCNGLGNPIFPLFGSKKELFDTGVAIAGVPLTLVYDTSPMVPANQADSSQVVEPNSFGPLWKSTLHHKLQLNSGLTSAMLSRGDGYVVNFIGPGDGTFVPAGGHPHKLASVAGGYLFTDAYSGQLETFDSAGVLQSMSLPSGRTLTFTYSNGNLVLVQSDKGSMVRFVYSNNLIVGIYGTDGGMTAIAYDSSGNVQGFTWSNGKTLGLLYENTTFPWATTGKTDENGQRLATYGYDSAGRAISTERAGGVDKHSVTYGTPPTRVVNDSYDVAMNQNNRTQYWSAPSGTTVTYPNAQTAVWGSQVVNFMPTVTSKSQPAGSGCSASTSAMSYDASGNLVSKDDFDGARSCYAYDASNRETVRVEGLSTSSACSTVLPAGSTLPAGARKITTTWHPDWHLAVTVTEPLRKRTTVYQGQPDPFNGNALISCTSAASRADGKPLPFACKRVQQALLANGTVDPGVTAATTTYAYDSVGHLTSATDPNGHTTSYAYFADTSFSGVYDPDFASTVLLLHGDGTNGSTAVADDGAFQRTFAPQGNVQISTGQSRFGGASIKFGGAGDALRASTASNLDDFGTADFTIEGFIYPTSFTADQVIAARYTAWATGVGFYLGTRAGSPNILIFRAGNNVPIVLNGNTPLALNQWQHVAVTRSAGVTRMFVDGVQQAATHTGSVNISSTSVLSIGAGPVVNDENFKGYIDELRITKGVARYTANFTPPAQAFAHSGPTASSLGHTQGDLQTMTNAKGQVTQYTQYDPAGRPRQMVDPKGITTDIAYTARGWVSSVTVTPPGGAARTTTYGYDDAGLLISASLPDGTGLSYSYDAAHRLTGITDTRGNSITYTLDTAGNRTAEEIRDSAGTLSRSITRTYDALNRLQQVTGAAQ
jgi:YD repeat-containing protein